MLLEASIERVKVFHIAEPGEGLEWCHECGSEYPCKTLRTFAALAAPTKDESVSIPASKALNEQNTYTKDERPGSCVCTCDPKPELCNYPQCYQTYRAPAKDER